MNKPKIAYFSMEVGIDPSIPTYSGGLGILAGDYLKSAADMSVPMIGITLMHNKGYFSQEINDGRQQETYERYDPKQHMKELPERIHFKIQGRDIKVKPWLYELEGNTGYKLPIIFLDTQNIGNDWWDEDITNCLYGGDGHDYHRIVQEILLGIGGVHMINEMKITPEVYHLNEGHGAFACLELERRLGWRKAKQSTVFTTHTPVPAGHDAFNYDLVYDVLQNYPPGNIRDLAGHDNLNMTILALNRSRHSNGVAEKHGEVSRFMFPGHDITSITNGIHSYTWTSPEFQELFDKKIPAWKNNPSHLKEVMDIPSPEILEAHKPAKARLIDYINKTMDAGFDKDQLTLGFARRFAPYKRADLIFSDLERLVDIGEGKLQIVFAGKAHPRDEYGKSIIANVHDQAEKLRGKVNVTFLPDYDIALGKLLTQGSDAWLNTPRRPREASGTSGMKAAHNGVPHISIDDGWQCEADEGTWRIGPKSTESSLVECDDSADANDLYHKLQHEILLTFHDKEKWAEVMKQAIAKNASFFNTHRMLDEYIEKLYKINLEKK